MSEPAAGVDAYRAPTARVDEAPLPPLPWHATLPAAMAGWAMSMALMLMITLRWGDPRRAAWNVLGAIALCAALLTAVGLRAARRVHWGWGVASVPVVAALAGMGVAALGRYYAQHGIG